MRVRRHPVVMRPDSCGGPIRADPSLAEPVNVDVVVPPFSDGLDDWLAALLVLIVWLKSVPQRMFC